MSLDDRDRALLEQAMHLAERGRGMTSPNPMVGALVVRDGTVLGEGFHAAPGQDHAEVAAMKAAVGDSYAGRLAGAEMVVTLEPCCHHGRTPPCVDALISAGVARVVVGAVDPSQHINGRGIERLRRAGIQVDLADGDVACRLKRQNDAFRTHVTRGLPFTTYKYAMTLDGKVATEAGDSRWISGTESRLRVHEMRAHSDAVIVGAGTLRSDDPRLTAREVDARRQPLRVVVDPRLEIKDDAAVLQTIAHGPVLLVAGEGAGEGTAADRRRQLESLGVQVAGVPHGADGALDPRAIARLLARRGVQSLLLEGGPRLAASWWDAGLVDRVVAFIAPVLAGGRTAPAPLPSAPAQRMDEALRLQDVAIEQVGADVMVSGYLADPV